MKNTKKTIACFLTIGTLFAANPVFAKDAEPKIAQDTASLPAELTFNIAKVAIANGVKEPLTVSKDGSNAKISGSNATICAIQLSTENQILGLKCK